MKQTVEYQSRYVTKVDLLDVGITPFEAWRNIRHGEEKTLEGDDFSDLVAQIADVEVPVYTWDIYMNWIFNLTPEEKEAARDQGLLDSNTTIEQAMALDLYLAYEQQCWQLMEEMADEFDDNVWNYSTLFPDGIPETGVLDTPWDYVQMVLEEFENSWNLELVFREPGDEDSAEECLEAVTTRVMELNESLTSEEMKEDLNRLVEILDCYFVGNMEHYKDEAD